MSRGTTRCLLELDAGRLARPVLRGGWRGDALSLPDYPSRTEGVDADIRLWVRGDEQHTGLDGYLYESVRQWIDDAWSFTRVAYPKRAD